jgi:rubrerythrin
LKAVTKSMIKKEDEGEDAVTAGIGAAAFAEDTSSQLLEKSAMTTTLE